MIITDGPHGCKIRLTKSEIATAGRYALLVKRLARNEAADYVLAERAAALFLEISRRRGELGNYEPPDESEHDTD